MPRGGIQIPYPPELWAKVKDLVIEGLAYKEISKQTGISENVIRSKAAISKWTIAKAERKAEGQLQSLRPKLHAHLHALTAQTRVPKSNSAKQLKAVADLVLTLAQTTKLVEGWQDKEEQTLVNVLQISNSVTTNPPKQALPGTVDAIDLQPVESSMLIPGPNSPEQTG